MDKPIDKPAEKQKKPEPEIRVQKHRDRHGKDHEVRVKILAGGERKAKAKG